MTGVTLLPAAMSAAMFGEILAALVDADRRADRGHFRRLWRITERHCDDRQRAFLLARFPHAKEPPGLPDMEDRLLAAEFIRRLGSSHKMAGHELLGEAARDGATDGEVAAIALALDGGAP